MHTSKFIPAALVALGAQLVAGQGRECSSSTYTITSAAQATDIPCRTMEGSVKIAEELDGAIDINGPTTIKGDLIVNNVTRLVSLSSSSLATIEGKFEMFGLTALNDLRFTQLATVKEIEWITLPNLGEFVFGIAGVTSAENVKISDTFLRSLDGLNLGTVDVLEINNNGRLSSYSTQLANVSTLLNIGSNGDELNVTLANLVWAKELVFANVASIELPSLEFINDSIRFDDNQFTSFIAPNLTEVGDGDVSFGNNSQISNISFPLLERIGGSLTILNNPSLGSVDGFPALEEIGGAVLFGGEFTEVELPALNDVKGAFDVVSTEDISDSCEEFDRMDGREIQGKYSCEGENEDANNANSSDSGNGNGGSRNNDNGSSSLVTNMAALVTVALVGGLAQIML